VYSSKVHKVSWWRTYEGMVLAAVSIIDWQSAVATDAASRFHPCKTGTGHAPNGAE